jgi:hypothetical protein
VVDLETTLYAHVLVVCVFLLKGVKYLAELKSTGWNLLCYSSRLFRGCDLPGQNQPLRLSEPELAPSQDSVSHLNLRRSELK